MTSSMSPRANSMRGLRFELAEELLQLVGLCEGPGLRTYIIWTPESGCSALRAPGHAAAGPAGLHR
jgi:hypothetical protein